MAKEQKLINGPELVAQLTKRIGPMVLQNSPADAIYKAMLACVADAPAVDAAPVVHGRRIAEKCSYQKTNADRIRGMSDEELRKLLIEFSAFACIFPDKDCEEVSCVDCVTKYLQQPAEEE